MMMVKGPKITIEVEFKGAQQAKSGLDSVKTSGAQAADAVKAASNALKEAMASGESLAGATKRLTNEQRLANATLRAETQAIKAKSAALQLAAREETAAARAAKKASAERKDSLKDIAKGISSIGAGARMLIASLATIGLVDLVKNVSASIDKFNLLEARVRGASSSMKEADKSMVALMATSNTTSASIDGVVSVFNRLEMAKGAIGATTDEVLSLTDTVSKLGFMSGASTEALRAGLMQFGQAMSMGVVHAEEFNSITENLPALAQEIAKGLHVSTGELKTMVNNGKVLSKDVFDALINSADSVNERFKQLPKTFGMVGNMASNVFGQLVHDIDKNTGLSQDLAGAMIEILKAVKLVSPAIVIMFDIFIRGYKSSILLGLSVHESIINLVRAAVGGGQAIGGALVGAFGVFHKMVDGIAVKIAGTINALAQKLKVATNGMVNLTGATGALVSRTEKDYAVAGNVEMALGKDWMAKGGARAKGGWDDAMGGSPLWKNAMAAAGSFYGIGIEVAQGRYKGRNAKSAFVFNQNPYDKPWTPDEKKKKHKKTDAEREAERYAKALEELKKKASEASLELSGLTTAQALLDAGNVEGYKSQIKKNELLKETNDLLGNYVGKNKAAIEALAKEVALRKQAIEEAKKYNEVMLDIGQKRDKTKRTMGEEQGLFAAFKKGGISGYTAEERRLEIQRSARESVSGLEGTKGYDKAFSAALGLAEQDKALEEYKQKTKDAVDSTKAMWEDLGSGIKDAFSSTINDVIDGTASFSQIMKALLQKIAAEMLRVFAIKAVLGIGQAFTGRFGAETGTMGTIAKGLGSMFPQIAGARAGGGSVEAGQSYLVGERGRELFVPHTSGNIVASPKLSGGGGVTVVNNINISTEGGQGQDTMQGLANAGKAIAAMVEAKVQAVLQKEMRQGGMLQRGYA